MTGGPDAPHARDDEDRDGRATGRTQEAAPFSWAFLALTVAVVTLAYLARGCGA